MESPPRGVIGARRPARRPTDRTLVEQRSENVEVHGFANVPAGYFDVVLGARATAVLRYAARFRARRRGRLEEESLPGRGVPRAYHGGVMRGVAPATQPVGSSNGFRLIVVQERSKIASNDPGPEATSESSQARARTVVASHSTRFLSVTVNSRGLLGCDRRDEFGDGTE